MPVNIGVPEKNISFISFDERKCPDNRGEFVSVFVAPKLFTSHQLWKVHVTRLLRTWLDLADLWKKRATTCTCDGI